jgi:hypothetical protein
MTCVQNFEINKNDSLFQTKTTLSTCSPLPLQKDLSSTSRNRVLRPVEGLLLPDLKLRASSDHHERIWDLVTFFFLSIGFAMGCAQSLPFASLQVPTTTPLQ